MKDEINDPENLVFYQVVKDYPDTCITPLPS
jgi:hypothetical protein